MSSSDDRSELAVPEEPGDLAQLYQQVCADDFRGPAWTKLSSYLIGYAEPRLRESIKNEEIFDQMKDRNFPYRRSPLAPDELDAEELALDAVYRGTQRFIQRARENHVWRPQGGARLTSWFYGDCLYEYSNIWRSWLRSNGWRLLEHQDIAELASLADTRYGPEDWAAYYEILDELLEAAENPVTLQILRMRLDGYDFRTIAKEVGETESATRKRYNRFVDGRRQAKGDIE